MEERIYTIGHSNHSLDRFIALLQSHGIRVVSDVRSRPYSRFNPQFDREELKRSLRERDILYVFLGKELGARSDDPSCYEGGMVQYGRLAKTPLFQNGVSRLMEGMGRHRIALMCAEKEPLDCHRTILVSRHLAASGVEVRHIHDDGRLEDQRDALRRLMRQLGMQESDLFRSLAELENEAYERQEARIAYAAATSEAKDATDRDADAERLVAL